MNFSEMLKQAVETTCFCEAKRGGQGFVNKNECPCYQTSVKDCQARQDKEQFHAYFDQLIPNKNELSYDEYTKASLKVRNTVLSLAEQEMPDSQWVKDNVK